MPAFMQMGHDTENLVGEEGLDFAGIVLSPLNRFPDEMQKNVQIFRSKGAYEIVLDSQLYFPKTEREKLIEYPYFPIDIDTVDLGADWWWKEINQKLSAYCQTLGIDAVTSPITCPRNIDDNFYATSVQVANDLLERIPGNLLTYQTVLADQSLLTDQSALLRAASILSDTDCSAYYLVFLSDTQPRAELADSFELLGALRFIRELKNTDRKIVVAFCSSDMLLYKCAGADSCATGKFFNLRRFTRSRFDEPSGGGGQLAYWFEHGLMAFLRQADLLRIRSKSLNSVLDQEFSRNVWSEKIVRQFAENRTAAWLGLCWRQYLAWFSQTEAFLDQSTTPQDIVSRWLSSADANWKTVDGAKIYLEERRNNGEWIRAWQQALSDFAGAA
jgi:hypothetical protein